ncbi:P-loop NTPase family protein [Oerskovia douganii]|uniref:AAA family ATPase n=1 Tax=Oerskovia douganii TaxID=2762210 RepID=UPI002AB2D961|nr:AAA family ATPase [Oerskovia douganii]
MRTVLGPLDDVVAHLGRTPRRVLVAGVSGAGKSTLAQRLAARLDLPYTELDALFHGPGWVPRATFLEDVRDVVGQEAFVVEWQYRAVRPLLLDEADLLVWLDLPTATVMRQVIGRTVRRAVRREVLWNGNVEPPLRTLLTDRDHIVRWAWWTRHSLRDLPTTVALQDRPVVLVRLRSRRQVETWVRRLPAPPSR